MSCGSATNPEERGLKTELTRTEGYHIHTSCVQLAFVDSYTHQATLRTKSFVDDFPVHVWVFIPPSLLDKSVTNQDVPVSSPSSSTPSGGGGVGAQNDKIHDAMFSFIAHAPQPIRAQLERLQLLFIMRLKDSFTEFKNSLMKFLVLPSASSKPSKKEGKEREARDGGREEGGIMVSESATGDKIREMDHHPGIDDSDHLLPQDAISSRDSVRSSSLSLFSSESGETSATISGCVLVESVEACILLPSIVKAQSLTTSGQSSTGPTSPTTPQAEGARFLPPSVAMTTQRASEEAMEVLVGGGVSTSRARYSEESIHVQGGQTGLSGNEELMTVGGIQTSQTSQAGFSISSGGGSATPSPRVSPTPSQMSLASFTSQTSQSSLSMSVNIGHALSPSITSLPTLVEPSGVDSDVISIQSFSARTSSTPSSLAIRPPMRSYSASHLPPVREAAITSSFPSAKGNRNSEIGSGHVSPVVQSERGSLSEGGSPVVHVTAIGGTGTVLHTQHESEVLWSESPHDSDYIMVERPSSPDTGKTGMTRRLPQDKPAEHGVPVEATEPPAVETQVVEQDTITPDVVQKLEKSSLHSASSSSLLSPNKTSGPASRRSSKSSLSSRRMKVQSPPKSEPLYNLLIKVGGVCALPNIQAKEISVRACVDSVELEEVPVAAESAESGQRQSQRTKKVEENDSLDVIQPKVKARIVIGDKVKELFPSDASHLDIVLIGKASDLDVSLLLPNALVMKDFFDDEFEAENPVPMHLRVENTRVVLMEEASHGPDHVKSMRLAVDRTDIHRGRKLLDSVDVFLERGSEVLEEIDGRLQNALSTETLHEDEDNRDTDHGKTDLCLYKEDERFKQSQSQLVESFNSFLKALELHLSQAGEQHLPRDQQVEAILQQIRAKSQEANRTPPSSGDNFSKLTDTGKVDTPPSQLVAMSAVDSPPSYYDTVSAFVANNYHQSKLSPPPSPQGRPPNPGSGTIHEELSRLRRENERLRQLEAEYQRENTLLLEKRESMVIQLSDFDMVTEECKSVKEQLVAYKQVMEKQHEQMERLLNENTELQRKLAMGASGRLHS